MTIAKPAPIDWFVLAGLVIAWGSAFAGLKLIAAEVAPAWVAAIRLIIAVIALALLLPLVRERLPSLRETAIWRTYLLVGVIGTALPFFLFAWASARADSAVVAICNGASPIATALLAHAFLAGERLTGRRAVGIALGFAGLGVLVAPKLASGLDAAALGVIAAVAGAFCYATGGVVARAGATTGAVAGALIASIAGAVLAAAAAVPTAPFPADASPQAWIILALLGLVSTGLGSVGWVYLINRRGPVFVSFVTYLSPLWATFVGVAFLAERPSPFAFAALALILAGVAVANRRSGAPR